MEQNFLTTEGCYTIVPVVKRYINDITGCKSRHHTSKFEVKITLTKNQRQRINNLGCREDCLNCRFEDCRLFT